MSIPNNIAKDIKSKYFVKKVSILSEWPYRWPEGSRRTTWQKSGRSRSEQLLKLLNYDNCGRKSNTFSGYKWKRKAKRFFHVWFQKVRKFNHSRKFENNFLDVHFLEDKNKFSIINCNLGIESDKQLKNEAKGHSHG